MKIVTNEKLIKTRKVIGRYTTIGSLVILGIGLYLSFQPQYMNYSFIALLVGFLLSQIGIYFGNRWGRSPRPDEWISQSLKGLDGKYTLYHYRTPVPHLLIGPAGIWVLLPYSQGGVITYNEEKKRWHQKGGNLYLKIFAQDSLGRPDLEITAYLDEIKRYFEKNLPNAGLPEPKAVLLFTNPKATIDADNAPVDTIPIGKLKEFIRKRAKSNPAPMDKIQILEDFLPSE